MRVALSEDAIDLAEHEALVGHRAAGAVVGFAGVVRDHDGGRHVTRLEYSAHPRAAADAHRGGRRDRPRRDGVRAIAVSHRIGTLHIGDAALVAAVAADHRRPRSRRAPCWSTR